MITSKKARQLTVAVQRQQAIPRTRWSDHFQRHWPAILAPFLLCGFALAQLADVESGTAMAALFSRLYAFGALLIFVVGYATFFVTVNFQLPPSWQAPKGWRAAIKLIVVMPVLLLFALLLLAFFDNFSELVNASAYLLKINPVP